MGRSSTDRLRRLGVAYLTTGVLLTPVIAWILWSNFLADPATAATTTIRGKVSKLLAKPGRTVTLDRATQADLNEAFAFSRVAVFPASDLIYVQRADAQNDAGDLIDTAGRWVAAADFSDPNFSGDSADGLFPARRGQQHGYIDDHGRWVIAPQFRGTQPFKNGVASVYTESGFQLIDTRGQVVVAATSKPLSVVAKGWVVAEDRWYLRDRNGQWTSTPSTYTEVRPFNDNLVIGKRGDQQMLVDRNGNPVGSERFEMTLTPINGRAVARKDGKWGVIDSQGHWQIAPRFESLGMNEDGLLFTQDQGRMQMLDDNGNPAPARNYRRFGKASEGLAGACQDTRCGYVDSSGQWIIAPQFENVMPFSDGVAQVMKNGLVAYIDRRGNLLTPAPPTNATAPYLWRPGAMRDTDSNNGGMVYGYLDRTGRLVVPAVFSRASDFSEHLAVVQAANNEFGFIDANANWVIPPTFHNALPFSEGLAMVQSYRLPMGFPAYIDAQGHIQLQLSGAIEKAASFRDGVANMQEWGGHTKLIDKNGNPVAAPPAKPHALPDLQRLSINGGKWGYADSQDRFVIAPRFDAAEDFSEELAAVKIGKQWGYINRSGRMVIPPSFDETGKFTEGLARVKTGDAWTYIDLKGQTITPETFAAANDFHEGLARVGIELGTAQRRVAHLEGSEAKIPSFVPNWPPMLSAGGEMRAGITWIKLVSGGYYDNYKMALMNKKGELIIPTGPPSASKPGG